MRRRLECAVASQWLRLVDAVYCGDDLLCYVALEGASDLFFRYGADDLLDNLSVLEHQDRRDAADVVTAGGVHRLVDVQLHYLELARVIVSDFRHGGCEHVAGTAPLSPEVDHYRLGVAGGEHFCFEVTVCNCRNIVVSHVLCPQRLAARPPSMSLLST